MKKRSVRKRTFKQRDQQLEDIHILSCRGFSQSQIANQLGLSQPQIPAGPSTVTSRDNLSSS
jgi:hypothetical protein